MMSRASIFFPRDERDEENDINDIIEHRVLAPFNFPLLIYNK